MRLFTSIYSKDGLVDVGRIVLGKVRELVFGIDAPNEVFDLPHEVEKELPEESTNFF